MRGLKKNKIAVAGGGGGRKVIGGGEIFKRKYFMLCVYSRSPKKVNDRVIE